MLRSKLFYLVLLMILAVNLCVSGIVYFSAVPMIHDLLVQKQAQSAAMALESTLALLGTNHRTIERFKNAVINLYYQWKGEGQNALYPDEILEEIRQGRQNLNYDLQKLMQSIEADHQARMFVFNSDFKIVLSSSQSAVTEVSLNNSNPKTGKILGQELIAAGRGLVPEVRFLPRQENAAADADNFEQIAWVRYFQPYDWYITFTVDTQSFHKDAAGLQKLIVLAFLTGLLFIPLVALLIVLRLRTPLRQMKQILEDVPTGDLTRRMGLKTGDEFGHLAVSVDEALSFLQKELARLTTATRTFQEKAYSVETAFNERTRFLVEMSHDIRTPVNGVMGMTNLLLGTKLSREQKEYAESIRQSAEYLNAVIGEILDFSKIEIGQLSLDQIDFDLRLTLDDIIGIMKTRTRKDNIELNCLIHHEVPSFVHGDPGRLKQILINLLKHMCKTSARNRISLMINMESETETDCHVRFIIKDVDEHSPLGGPAPPAPPEPPDTTTQDAAHDLNLGLMVSKQLAEKMDGKFGFQISSTNTYWFTVRFIKSRTPKPVSPSTTAAQIKNAQILIVDDNATNRRILQKQLNPWRCKVDEAESGPQCLEKLQQAHKAGFPFHVALIDKHMPGMDGEALGKAIKADPLIADTAMVIITAMGERGDANRFKELGFLGYLTMPVDNKALADCLKAVMNIAANADAAGERPFVTRYSIEEDKKRNARILLVEDNAVNRMVALKLLSKLGFQAESAENGQQALARLEAGAYDLVLMDIQMPVMDGIEATRIIRDKASKTTNHEVPIIALTALDAQNDMDRCLAAGMNDYLTKPIKPDKLSAAVEKYILKTSAQH